MMDLFGARLRRVRDAAPVGRLLLMAWGAVLVWLFLAGVLTEQMRWAGFGAGVRLSGSGRFLGLYLISSLKPAFMFVLFVAVLYTPGLIVLAGFFDRRLSIRLTLRQEYAGTLSCVLAVLSASLFIQILPMILVATLVQATEAVIAIIFLPLPVFVVLMVPVTGVLFSLRPLSALVLTLLSLGSLLALPAVMHAAATVCASPLLVIFLLFLLRDRIDDLIRNSRSRDNFRRQLEQSTLNPADASAHYNLGLLYQQQGDSAAAKRSFTRAVEIDPGEIDSHYQLGRIARDEGLLTAALEHFNAVITLDPVHAHHEIWREVGRVYFAAGQFEDALVMLDRFVRLRPSDAEGRYLRGMVLDRLGREPEAFAEMRECVEAARTSPAYKYRRERHWLALAEEFLRVRGDRHRTTPPDRSAAGPVHKEDDADR